MLRRLLGGGYEQPPIDLGEGKEDAGYGYWFEPIGEYEAICTDRAPWLESHGTWGQKLGALTSQWFAFAMCVCILIFYAYHTWKASCGWVSALSTSTMTVDAIPLTAQQTIVCIHCRRRYMCVLSSVSSTLADVLAALMGISGCWVVNTAKVLECVSANG